MTWRDFLLHEKSLTTDHQLQIDGLYLLLGFWLLFIYLFQTPGSPSTFSSPDSHSLIFLTAF